MFLFLFYFFFFGWGGCVKKENWLKEKLLVYEEQILLKATMWFDWDPMGGGGFFFFFG